MLAHEHAALPGVVPLALMWLGMMSVMMAPSAFPWVRTLDRFAGVGRGRFERAADAAAFGVGYLSAWAVYSIGAALLQQQLQGTGVLDPVAGASAALGAGILVAAGLYQLAPLKNACLQHCRSPIGYFLTRWRAGRAGSWRMGLEHGLFCVGCCWALMLTALAVGLMNFWWMVALAVAATAEQVTPWGHRLRVPIGSALLASGLARLL